MVRKCNTLLIGGSSSSSSFGSTEESFRHRHHTFTSPRNSHHRGLLGHHSSHSIPGCNFQLHRPLKLGSNFLPVPGGHHGRFSTLVSIGGDGEDENKSCGTIHQILPAKTISTKNIITTPVYQKHGHGNDCGSGSSNRNQNIAIATQVLSPSAIGGSGSGNASQKILKGRLIKSFRQFEQTEDEDNCDNDIFNRRKGPRINWSRIGCCGASVIVTVILLTGILLAVGYLQAEKQKITTRPSKLAQNDDYSNEASLPSSIIIPIVSDNFHEHDDNQNEEEQLEKLETSGSGPGETDQVSTTELNPTNHEKEEGLENAVNLMEADMMDNNIIVSELDNNANASTSDSENEKPNQITFVNNNRLENESDSGSSSSQKEIIDPKPNTTQIEVISIDENNRDSLHSSSGTFEHQHQHQVKVLPSSNKDADFGLHGFSFQIPIYNVSNPNIDALRVSLLKNKYPTSDFDLNTAYSTIATKATEKSAQNNTSTKTFIEEEQEPLPTNAKLQTDLFEEDEGEEGENEESEVTLRSTPTHHGYYQNRHNNNYKGPPRVVIMDPGYTPRPTGPAGPIEKPDADDRVENSRQVYKPKIRFVKIRPEVDLRPPVVSSPIPPSNFHEYHQNLRNGNRIYEHDVNTNPPEIQYSVTTSESPTTPTQTNTYVRPSDNFNEFSQKSHNSDNGASTTPVPFHFDYTQFTTSPTPVGVDPFQSSLNKFDFELGLSEKAGAGNLPNFNFDSSSSTSSYNLPQASNPNSNDYYSFGNNLLSSPSITNVMGLPSSIGANLNLYNPAPSHNSNDFDFGNSNNGIPTGIVPIDLSKSFIPVTIGHGVSNIDNFGNNNQGGYNFGSNTQNFNLAGTGAAQTNNNGYNTITGGIQLLNLLSGNFQKPNQNHGNNNFDDQFSSGSDFSQILNNNNRPIDYANLFKTDINPYMTAYNIPTISTFNPYLQAQGRSFNTDDGHGDSLHSSSSRIFRQKSPSDPYDDQVGSFSQTIISKLKYANELNQIPIASPLISPAKTTASRAGTGEKEEGVKKESKEKPALEDSSASSTQVLDILGIKDILEQFSNLRNSRSDDTGESKSKTNLDKEEKNPLELVDKDNDKQPPVKKDGASILGNKPKNSNSTDLETAASELFNSEIIRIAKLNNNNNSLEKEMSTKKNNNVIKSTGLQSAGFYG